MKTTRVIFVPGLLIVVALITACGRGAAATQVPENQGGIAKITETSMPTASPIPTETVLPVTWVLQSVTVVDSDTIEAIYTQSDKGCLGIFSEKGEQLTDFYLCAYGTDVILSYDFDTVDFKHLESGIMLKACREDGLCSQAVKLQGEGIATPIPQIAGAQVGQYPPDSKALGLDGVDHYLSEYKTGNKLVVNFWATWCGPCNNEFLGLIKVAQNNPQVTFLLVDQAEDRDTINAFLKKYGVLDALPANVIILRDTSYDFSDAFEAMYLPTTVVIDANGMVINRCVGVIWDDFESYLK